MARQADKRLPVTFRQGRVVVVLLLVLGVIWVVLSKPNRLGTMLGEASLQKAGERRSLARDGAGHDAGAASGDAGAAFAETSAEIDPYLRIPAVVQRPNAHLVKPYKRMQKGLRLTYRGNRFSANQPDLIWVPEVTRDRYKLRWETLGKKVEGAGLAGVFPGNVLRILDDELYDFGVGTLFVRVLNETSASRVTRSTRRLSATATRPTNSCGWRATCRGCCHACSSRSTRSRCIESASRATRR